MKKQKNETLFPISVFLMYFGILLVMCGIHMGLLVMMDRLAWNQYIQIFIPLLYWFVVSLGLTIYTRWRIQKTYDAPMKKLAEATKQVAGGDFSIYVAPNHTSDQADYIDRMLMDFNKMVAELGSIETLKTDFFTNVSHEIKTPLAVIQSNAILLQKHGDDPEKRKEYTENMIHSTKRLSDLITNMLKLNKLERQTILPKPEPYNLCEQLCRCALQFEELWEKKNIVFEADLEDVRMIEADEELLEMVWNNLFSNAVKFTPEGGCITLCQNASEHGITVSVSDTGCGMDEEMRKHIFEKFYQGDTSHMH